MSIVTVEHPPALHLASNLACLAGLNADIAAIIAANESAKIELCETPAGVPGITFGGKPLCSRRDPIQEANRLIESIDVVEHAVLVVLGFGAGYHVQQLAKRVGKAGLIIVYEPDVAMLRAVLENVDHSEWLNQSQVLWVIDGDDRARLAQKLLNADSILAQGVHILPHPASRERLGDGAGRFTAILSQHVASARTTLTTTLVRSSDTVRNLILNLDHYSAGEGIAPLRDVARGCLGVVVSAGPSLQKNIHLLAAPGVRERCLIVATQTTLKPLLKAGVKPHFVTALDYHEISKRFYDDITAEDVVDTTLIADPKAHPIILDAYPGAIRCCGNGFLDKVLGPLARDMGTIRPGATVAHLAMYLARFLGCEPVAMIGQDLGFTDGVYYSRGTAIDDVWCPELNPFNTIEMMEWQRIARHRLHLLKTKDVFGKTIYTDSQMRTYLQQFERDFSEDEAKGLTIIDATEGGVPKQHTIRLSLRQTLDQYARQPLPAIPLPTRDLDPIRRERCRRQLNHVRVDIQVIAEASAKSGRILDRMIDQQSDDREMERQFEKLDAQRREVGRRQSAFEILNHVNQLGVFRRFKADRRLHFAEDASPLDRQRLQLLRDRDNVSWIGEAAHEFLTQIDESDRLLRGLPPRPRTPIATTTHADAGNSTTSPARIAAVVPIDPQLGGLGHVRDLDSLLGDRPVLQQTLERVGRCKHLERIVLLVADGFNIEPLIDRSRIALPLDIHTCGDSPFGPERKAITAARAFADTSWRGGIGGMSIYDEVLCPKPTLDAMDRFGFNAAILVGPDWPLVDISEESGIDAIARRHAEHPEQLPLVFTQAPPGIGACLVSRTLFNELALGNRLCTIGSLLVYQPHAPQHDPIARDANVQINHAIRQSLIRATFDSPRYKQRIRRAIEPLLPTTTPTTSNRPDTAEAIVAVEQQWLQLPTHTPKHIILELCTGRGSCGVFGRGRDDVVQRLPLSMKLVEKILPQLVEARDTVMTLGGIGDPLRHPDFDRIIRFAKHSGVKTVHIRTELGVPTATLDRLLRSGVDIVSVDVHANSAETYRHMMGLDRFKLVLDNMAYLVEHRQKLTDHHPTAAFALPWIVPRMQRCPETFDEIDDFFERWQHLLGACVIDGPPPWDCSAEQAAAALSPALASTRAPARHMIREGLRRMTIHADGGVPISELDVHGDTLVGNVADTPLLDLWRDLFSQRRELQRTLGDSAEALRTFAP